MFESALGIAKWRECFIVHAELIPTAQDCLSGLGDVASFVMFSRKLDDVL